MGNYREDSTSYGARLQLSRETGENQPIPTTKGKPKTHPLPGTATVAALPPLSRLGQAGELSPSVTRDSLHRLQRSHGNPLGTGHDPRDRSVQLLLPTYPGLFPTEVQKAKTLVPTARQQTTLPRTVQGRDPRTYAVTPQAPTPIIHKRHKPCIVTNRDS